jgi:acetyltransferase-like isoleucine patch superfamily enzyme
LARSVKKLPWLVTHRAVPRALSRMKVEIIRATHLHCRVEFQGPVRIGPGFQLEIPETGTFIVGPGVDFRRGFVCEIVGHGRVEIGANTVFTSNCLIQCATSIEIGSWCAFGQSVLIVDGYHRYADPDVHWFHQGYDFRPLKIGNGVGVSDKCTVQADIGERAMIASQTVIDRPIPPYCVAAGKPARVVRFFGPPELRPAALEPRRSKAEAAGTVEPQAGGEQAT